MNMGTDTLLTIIAALGGLELIKWFATRKSTGRMAGAQADREQISALAARERLYEDTISFLQTQLIEKEKLLASLQERLQKSTESELLLTRLRGETEIKYLSTRCDKTDCQFREPPLSYLAKLQRADTQ